MWTVVIAAGAFGPWSAATAAPEPIELPAALPPIPGRPAPAPRAAWQLLFDGLPVHVAVSGPDAGGAPEIPVAEVAWWLDLPAMGGPAAAALGLRTDIDAAAHTIDLRQPPERPAGAAGLLLPRSPASPAPLLREIGAARAAYVDLEADGALELVTYTPSDGRSAQWISVLRRGERGWERVSRVALPASYVEPAEIDFVAVLPGGWQVHARSGERHALYYWDPWLHGLERIRWKAFQPSQDPVSPPPPPPAKGDLIRIDRAHNALHLFRDGKLLKAYRVATGRGNLTPVGRFEVVLKAHNPAWKTPEGKIIPGNTPANPLGSRWLGLSAGAEPGLIYGIHGTNEPFSIGAPASSGCVRMLNPQVEELFELVAPGTPVEID